MLQDAVENVERNILTNFRRNHANYTVAIDPEELSYYNIDQGYLQLYTKL